MAPVPPVVVIIATVIGIGIGIRIGMQPRMQPRLALIVCQVQQTSMYLTLAVHLTVSVAAVVKSVDAVTEVDGDVTIELSSTTMVSYSPSLSNSVYLFPNSRPRPLAPIAHFDRLLSIIDCIVTHYYSMHLLSSPTQKINCP
jgi:hypothetical protein